MVIFHSYVKLPEGTSAQEAASPIRILVRDGTTGMKKSDARSIGPNGEAGVFFGAPNPWPSW